MTFRADMRAAAVTLLEAYAQAESIKLQVYPGRPRSIQAPTAFVDSISEGITYPGVSRYQRTPTVNVVVIHGLFDTKDTAAQGDAFVDGFVDYVAGQLHAAGANTVLAIVATEDDPNYIPGWLSPELQKSYYATTFSLEGFAGI